MAGAEFQSYVVVGLVSRGIVIGCGRLCGSVSFTDLEMARNRRG